MERRVRKTKQRLPGDLRRAEHGALMEVVGRIARLAALTNLAAWVIAPIALLAIVVALIFF